MMIDKFVSFKEPIILEDRSGIKGGIVFRTHVITTDGKHLLISDACHGNGIYAVDETLVFECDEEGTVTDWTEVAGGRGMRTDDVIREMNET